MFNPNRPVIEAFVKHLLADFNEAYPGQDDIYTQTLEQCARLAMETLLNCDCSYHDLHHTILVTDVGQSILLGRLITDGDVTPLDWLHGTVGMLFHDIGYRRGLLRDDLEASYIADEYGNRITPPAGATDAYLTPYHVTRSCLYVHERFADHPLLDDSVLAANIEMTRFPVPNDSFYKNLASFSGLVRAADLIGQMGDPQYLHKLSRLYAEFVETGDAQRQGYNNAGELRAGYPDFFFEHVYPYITEGLKYLRKTQAGQQWVTNLFHHVHSEQENDPSWGPERQADPLGDWQPDLADRYRDPDVTNDTDDPKLAQLSG